MSPKPTNKTLLLIAYAFPPHARSGTHRNLRFAKYLSELGWEISVLSAKPQHFRRGTPVDEALLAQVPSAVGISRTAVLRPLEALVRLRSFIRSIGRRLDQNNASAKVAPAAQNTEGGKGLKDWISSALSFPDAEVGWVPGAVLKGMSLIRRRRIKLIFSSGPPHSCHLVGWALKWVMRVPWVADFRDPWTRRPWLDAASRETLAHRGKVFLERKIVERADLVLLNTDEAREDFAAFYRNIPSDKFVTLSNGYNPDSLPRLQETSSRNKAFRAVHAGAFYKKRHPLGLLRALKALIDEKRLDPKDIHFQFIGPCALDALGSEMAALNLGDCVEWIPWLDHRKCLEVMASSDLLLLIQPGTHLQIPAKVFEYLMLKKKMLALTGPGATASLIQKYDLGAVVDPEDIEGIKTVLLCFIKKRLENNAMSEKYRLALEVFHARSLSKVLDKHLTQTLKRRKTRAG